VGRVAVQFRRVVLIAGAGGGSPWGRGRRWFSWRRFAGALYHVAEEAGAALRARRPSATS
jgi:hypothetical protein